MTSSDVAGLRGTEGAAERSLRELAQRLAGEDPALKYTYRITCGLSLHYRGCFKEAKEVLDPLQAISTNRRVGAQSALLFTLHSIQLLGDMSDLTDRYTRTLVDAEDRSNLFMSVALRTSFASSVWLAADDPKRARRELREAMSQWAQKRFSTLEWRATLGEAEVDLYVGDAESAYERVRELLRVMTRNFYFVHSSKVLVVFVQGRSAIASLHGLTPARRSARLRAARRLTRAVGDVRMPWTAPLASILEAGLAQAMGRRADAASALQAAVAGADLAHMAMHAAAARHELGLLIGGSEGATLVRNAEETMTARGVHAPARFARMLVPGHRGPNPSVTPSPA